MDEPCWRLLFFLEGVLFPPSWRFQRTKLQAGDAEDQQEVPQTALIYQFVIVIRTWSGFNNFLVIFILHYHGGIYVNTYPDAIDVADVKRGEDDPGSLAWEIARASFACLVWFFLERRRKKR